MAYKNKKVRFDAKKVSPSKAERIHLARRKAGKKGARNRT